MFDSDISSRITVGNVNMHYVFVAHVDPKVREFYQSFTTFNHLDGWPIVLFGKALGSKLSSQHLTGWLTGFDRFLGVAASKGQRIYYLGSKPGVAAKMAEIKRKEHPGLIIEAADGYFKRDDPVDNGRVIDVINQWDPDILVVGMGVPIQERWLLDNRAKIRARVAVQVGATADYVAGVIPMPPPLLDRLHLMAPFRLLSEPRRLWKRYLLEPWAVVVWFLWYGRRLRKD